MKKITLSVFLTLSLLAAPFLTGTPSTEKTPVESDSPIVHGVVDLAHSFSFYGDGRFAGQYLTSNNKPSKKPKQNDANNGAHPNNKMATNCGNLYDYPTDNINLLVFLACNPKVPYTEKDYAYIDSFLKNGGAVLIMGTPKDAEQSKLAEHFGASFGERAKAPLKPTDKLLDLTPVSTIQGSSGTILELKNPKSWTILVTDKNDKPLLAQRKEGKGTVIIASRSLAGSHPDASDNINADWLGKVIAHATQAKVVNPKKNLRSHSVTNQGNTKKEGTLLYHYSDYLAPYLDAMIKIDTKIRPIIEKRMGVPLSPGMATQVGLLATGGGGFSSGQCIGLAVFWGDFPEKEDSMIEFLTHESVHSWVLPHAEVSNEPIATYMGNLVMIDAGYPEEGQKRIDKTIGKALDFDPEMKLYALNGTSTSSDAKELNDNEKRALNWGKSYWIWEEMRKKDPAFQSKYFQAKRQYVPKTLPARYSLDDTVAVMSYALGEDFFPWFNDHGMPVSKDKVQFEIPAPDTKE